ncbi:MAG: MFS transporter [Candidatus Ranarchaeia archaeon]
MELKNYGQLSFILVYLLSANSLINAIWITPNLPEIVLEFGMSIESVGLIRGISILPGIISTPLFGILSDYIGRKKIIVSNLILFGLSGPLIIFVSNFSQLIILLLIQGFCAGTFFPMAIIILADMAKRTNLNSVYSKNNAAFSIGLIIHSIIGGYLGSLNWRIPFIFFIVNTVLGLLILHYLPETFDKENKEKRPKGKMMDLFRNPAFILLFLSGMIIPFIIQGSNSSLSLVLLTDIFLLPQFERSLILGFQYLITSLASISVLFAQKKIKDTTLVVISFMFLGIGLLISSILTFISAIFGFLLIGIGSGIIQPVSTAMTQRHATPTTKGQITSYRGILFKIGQTMGPISGSLILFYYPLQIGFQVYSIIAIFCFLITIASVAIKKRSD